ncbi:MAG: hypothetical protein H6592_03685 [Flavobacteriales bacterium]|nr:hypothetical protein [Flavobacteriales bacterium]
MADRPLHSANAQLFLPGCYPGIFDGINDELLVGMDCTPRLRTGLLRSMGSSCVPLMIRFAWTTVMAYPIWRVRPQLNYSWHACGGMTREAYACRLSGAGEIRPRQVVETDDLRTMTAMEFDIFSRSQWRTR